MISTIAIDDNNEIIIENGMFKIVNGVDALVLQIKQLVQTFKGEWFMNTDAGIDYLGTIFSKKTTQAQKYIEFKLAIEQLYYVKSVVNVNFVTIDANKRTYKYELEILSDYGKINVGGTL